MISGVVRSSTNAEKRVGVRRAETPTKGDARTSVAFDDSQNAEGPQIATRYSGSVLLTAMALGFLLGRAVSRR
jgi:hypothetical protein